jgi:hypothetical protein
MHCFERCVPAPFFLSLFFARFRCLFRFRFFLHFFSGGERGRARGLRGLLSAFVNCSPLSSQLLWRALRDEEMAPRASTACVSCC